MISIKEFVNKKSLLESGHRTCSGCAIPIIFRTVMRASDKPLVVANATGCGEVTTTIYPYSSWKCSYIHNAFENAAATISGIEAAFKALKKKGRMKKNFNFLVFGGDGGTTDIGLQSLSGALERGHDFVYVQYDNEGYMNTGNQRSGATPFGAATTTTPLGSEHKGKELFRKDITSIAAAHGISYVAQAAVHNWSDLYEKAKKAFAVKGPAFINVFCPCTFNWKFDSSLTIEVSKLAVNSTFWPLYEVENGNYKLNYKPTNIAPLENFLKLQRRFRHLLKPENAKLLDKLKEHIEKNWLELLRKCNVRP